MSVIKQHKGVTRAYRGGECYTTTLCGRSNTAHLDGLNIATDDAGVTCVLCLRRMTELAERAEARGKDELHG